MRKDAELEGAVRQAQSRLPDFLNRLTHPRKGDQFAVQVHVTEDGAIEHLWLKNPSSNGRRISGQVANRPILLKQLNQGDRLDLDVKSIDDWIIHQSDGQTIGGFAQAILKQRQSVKK